PLLDFYACTFSLLFCQSFFTHPDLHSFPTRRSSDLGDLPPNSKVILLTSSAASLETSLPPLVEPVNVIIFTSLCVDNTFPTSDRSEEHTSELQSRFDLVCRLLLEKKNKRRHSCHSTN